MDNYKKDAMDSDEALDAAIDNMLSDFEKAGKSHDQCFKAMSSAIDRAKEPLTISQWTEASKLDTAGRRKYSDDLFEPEAVKSVVLDLVKKAKAVRIGRQTFCSHVVIGEMADAIDNIMMWNCCICDLEEMAVMLGEYDDDCVAIIPMPKKKFSPQKPFKAVSPKGAIISKMRNFIEEKIMRLALNQLESIIEVRGEYFHITTPEICSNYAQQALEGRAIKNMSLLEFFAMVGRVNFNGMDNQFEGRSIKAIKQILHDDIIRDLVIGTLKKRNVITVVDDKVSPYKKPDKYLWLDD